MKYAFHIVDVFSSTPFGGNQLAVLPNAAGISTEGMQKIAREFNFGETIRFCVNRDHFKEAGGWRVTGIMVQAESATAPLPKEHLP